MMSSFIFPIMLDTSSFHVDRCCELFKGGYLSQSSIVLVMMDVSVWRLCFCYDGVVYVALLLLEEKMMVAGRLNY